MFCYRYPGYRTFVGDGGGGQLNNRTLQTGCNQAGTQAVMVIDPATKKCKFSEEEKQLKVIQRSERTEASSEGEKRDENNIPTAENRSEGYTYMILVSLGRGNGQKHVLLTPTEIPNNQKEVHHRVIFTVYFCVLFCGLRL